MNKLIMVSSITYAMKGRDILRNNGYKAYIERTPNQLDRQGCGYSIYIEGNLNKALELLKEQGIKILGYSDGGKK